VARKSTLQTCGWTRRRSCGVARVGCDGRRLVRCAWTNARQGRYARTHSMSSTSVGHLHRGVLCIGRWRGAMDGAERACPNATPLAPAPTHRWDVGTRARYGTAKENKIGPMKRPPSCARSNTRRASERAARQAHPFQRHRRPLSLGVRFLLGFFRVKGQGAG
jgi:hypothetical protein